MIRKNIISFSYEEAPSVFRGSRKKNLKDSLEQGLLIFEIRRPATREKEINHFLSRKTGISGGDINTTISSEANEAWIHVRYLRGGRGELRNILNALNVVDEHFVLPLRELTAEIESRRILEDFTDVLDWVSGLSKNEQVKLKEKIASGDHVDESRLDRWNRIQSIKNGGI